MQVWVQMLITFLCALVASSGFWAFVAKRSDKNDAEKDLLIGLAHDRIIFLGKQYVTRGYITPEEYENLNMYLYEPYERAGGNGTAKRIMDEVRKLPSNPHSEA